MSGGRRERTMVEVWAEANVSVARGMGVTSAYTGRATRVVTTTAAATTVAPRDTSRIRRSYTWRLTSRRRS